jgi:hypothetical protein
MLYDGAISGPCAQKEVDSSFIYMEYDFIAFDEANIVLTRSTESSANAHHTKNKLSSRGAVANG